MSRYPHPDAALREIELAVMPLRDSGEHERGRRVQEAADALAELIAAAEAAHHHLKELRRRVSATSHDDADYLTEVESDTSALHAALDRCRGGES